MAAATAAGFEAAGLRPEPGTSPSRIRRVVADTGVPVLDVEVVRIGTTTAAETDRLLDYAVEVGARYILVVSDLPDTAATAAELHRINQQARGTSVRPVLEFMRFTTVPDLPAALTLVREVGEPYVGILVDALHLARSGGSPAEVAAVDAAFRPYVQICDAPATGPSTTDALAVEARHHRLLPGHGALPLAELLRAFAGGVVSVEVQSDSGWRSGSTGQWARQAFDAGRALVP